jgi:hypothetical protein
MALGAIRADPSPMSNLPTWALRGVVVLLVLLSPVIAFFHDSRRDNQPTSSSAR